MATKQDIWRFEVRDRGAADPRAAGLPDDARALGLGRVTHARTAKLFFVRGTMAPEELDLLGRFLFSDLVVEEFAMRKLPIASEIASAGAGEGRAVVEVLPRPGVTDATAQEALRAAGELGIEGLGAVSVGMRWELEGVGLDEAFFGRLVPSLLANPLVERWSIGEIMPIFLDAGDMGGAEAGFRTASASGAEAGGGKGRVPSVESIDLSSLDDAGLEYLSRARRAALDLGEMRAIREYYSQLGRSPTDIEFEMLAQTWSEHCVHKTFKASIEVDAPGSSNYPPTVDSIFSTYIRRPTEEIGAPWVLSAFVDNAGVIEFDEDFEVSFKVETHNHPSAVEPFGGANTGLGGVIRDIMGVSARPIAATDVLCFGPQDTAPEKIATGALHPRLVARGVVAGIEDYGNKMGIPTVNGGLCYHEGYVSNPLVYCGCVGLAPRGARRSAVAKGDRVIVIGGRTGRDGIRGATFSSMTMDAATGEVAGASVQIGDPITQKKALDALLAGRDRGLYHAVTDCGAGGLSSAIGEMGAVLGVDVELSAIGTKYPGLAPWELWLSEAQERMVLAVAPEDVGEMRALCETYNAGFYDLGAFSGSGRIVARMNGLVVLDLSTEFLREGMPRKLLKAAPGPRLPVPIAKSSPPGLREALLRLLSRPGSDSAEAIVRRYDHEVQGGTLLAPFDGPWGEAPQDGAVIVPQGTSGRRALAIANGFRPAYAVHDPYNAAVSAHDECLRSLVAVGADPERIAVLDNFCMGDPNRPEVLWDLLESARACRDVALEYRTPFISGKDSFFNEYAAEDGLRRSVPPSLLISGMGLVPFPDKVPGSWLKAAGNRIYLVGSFEPRFGGSLYASCYGAPQGCDSEVPGRAKGSAATYKALHVAIGRGVVASVHDISEGGVAATIAEMCMGGRLGARITLSSIRVPDRQPLPRMGAGGAVEGAAVGRVPVGKAAVGRVPVEAALFGETNGCLLVEVAEIDMALFESTMEGTIIAGIGFAQKEPTVIFEMTAERGAADVTFTLEELAAVWKGGSERSK